MKLASYLGVVPISRGRTAINIRANPVSLTRSNLLFRAICSSSNNKQDLYERALSAGIRIPCLSRFTKCAREKSRQLVENSWAESCDVGLPIPLLRSENHAHSGTVRLNEDRSVVGF